MDLVKFKTALITGANVGIGMEVARQLALSDQYQKIYLGCRNKTKAGIAKKQLEATTGKSIFEVMIVDVSDLDAVRAAMASLSGPLDVLVMNAGGMAPVSLTKDGVTEMKNSGLGREEGLDELLSYTENKTIHVIL